MGVGMSSSMSVCYIGHEEILIPHARYNTLIVAGMAVLRTMSCLKENV